MDLVPKFKMLMAFAQVGVALPSVYGLSHQMIEQIWGQTFDLIALDFEVIFIPGVCVGDSYLQKLNLYCLLPLLHHHDTRPSASPSPETQNDP